MNQNLQKRLLTWLILAVMLVTTAIVYICPMRISMGETSFMSTASNPHMCGEEGNATGLSSDKAAGNCIDFHLGLTDQIIASLIDVVNVMVLLAVSAALAFLFTRKIFANRILFWLVKLRDRHREYLTRIRLTQEKKLRQYLTLLGSTVVSIA